VITSSAAAGRLLGLCSDTPQLTEVLEDLLTVGEGLDIAEREIAREEAGPVPAALREGVVLGVVRGGELLRFGDPRAAELQPGDRLIELLARGNGSAGESSR
jgi:voltage-gated potassium channel